MDNEWLQRLTIALEKRWIMLDIGGGKYIKASDITTIEDRIDNDGYPFFAISTVDQGVYWIKSQKNQSEIRRFFGIDD